MKYQSTIILSLAIAATASTHLSAKTIRQPTVAADRALTEFVNHIAEVKTNLAEAEDELHHHLTVVRETSSKGSLIPAQVQEHIDIQLSNFRTQQALIEEAETLIASEDAWLRILKSLARDRATNTSPNPPTMIAIS